MDDYTIRLICAAVLFVVAAIVIAWLNIRYRRQRKGMTPEQLREEDERLTHESSTFSL